MNGPTSVSICGTAGLPDGVDGSYGGLTDTLATPSGDLIADTMGTSTPTPGWTDLSIHVSAGCKGNQTWHADACSYALSFNPSGSWTVTAEIRDGVSVPNDATTGNPMIDTENDIQFASGTWHLGDFAAGAALPVLTGYVDIFVNSGWAWLGCSVVFKYPTDTSFPPPPPVITPPDTPPDFPSWTPGSTAAAHC
jgi:hypothetical protein